MEADWVVLYQALYQSIGVDEWTENRREEGWAQDCWFGQTCVAKVGQGTLLFVESGICKPPSTKGPNFARPFLDVWDVDFHKASQLSGRRVRMSLLTGWMTLS